MPSQRVLAIGLDGLEVTLAERLMAAGEMPALAALRGRAARFLLDHGPAQRTGLAWEHVASGRSPESARRWAAVEFDPATYRAWQEGARFTPWWTALERRVVVFDTPYVDLRLAPGTRGIVAWGAHDPGAVTAGRPRQVLFELRRRFGDYPSHWTYGTPWPSPRRSREMGEVLSGALAARARAARWLATERLADWDLFIAVEGELHGAIEGLWHGVDPDHPLYKHPSAPEAAQGLIAVHRALDRMVGELVHCAGDAAVVAFTMGGMGVNHSDVQSMVLLPELLYRHAFGRPLLTVPPSWTSAPDAVPILDEDDSWGAASGTWLPAATPSRGGLYGGLRAFAKKQPLLTAAVKGVRVGVAEWRAAAAPTPIRDLHWQPARRYGPYWPQMPAFALPSYYDGRIRLNLRGRERDGMVDPSRYEETCRSLEALLGECRNPLTGEPAVESIERAATRDPLALSSSESDLLVIWRGVATALEHPRLGLIGPVLTAGELRRQVARARAGLARLGVGRGDRVVAYLPNIPETLIAFLATASLGAVWASCAPEFGTRSVLDRFTQIDPKVLLAIDGYRYGTKAIDRTAEVAAIREGLPGLAATVAVPYLDPDAGAASIAGSVSWDELLADDGPLDFQAVPFDHPLYILYSSGTTGLPKPIVHGHGGILLEHLKQLAFYTDLGPGDRFFWFSTTGWMMWNLLVSGLAVGSALVLFDGDLASPDLLTLWRLAEETGMTYFGASAPFLLACRKAGIEPAEVCDLSRIKGIGSTGAPLPPEGFRWVYEAVTTDAQLNSISGGTDVCSAFVGACPLLPVREGRISGRILGAKVEAFDPDGRPVMGEQGELVITEPMPSMPVGFWGDDDGSRYRAAYFEDFPGVWRHGDWIVFDDDGSCVISGRSDSTLNRGGVRLGTAEFYSVVEAFPEVADSLVVHLEDQSDDGIGMGELLLFVVPAEGQVVDDDLKSRIAAELRRSLSPRHTPDAVYGVGGIPRTLSGKKLEVPVKRILTGTPTDVAASRGALANPDSLAAFERLAAERASP